MCQKAEKKHKKKHKPKEPKEHRVKYYIVTQEPDGALVCTCPEFAATGKTCAEICAARLQLEFGPATPYLISPENPQDDDSDSDAPLRKPQNKKSKGIPKPKRASGAGRKPREELDHRVDTLLDEYLDRLDRGWNPFGSDDEIDDDSDSEPAKKKSKTGDTTAPGTTVSRGRPPAATPLHPGRTSSPTKFSEKPGPKGKGFNSLLPPLHSAKKPKSPTKKKSKPPAIPPSEAPQNGPTSNGSGKQNPPQKDNKDKGKKTAAAVQPSALNAEDLDILDIDFKRWDSPNYKLRSDEVLEIIELLNALSLDTRNGTLVFGHSYSFEADQLRNIDWMTSDDEPINAAGAPAFLEGTVLKNAWLHSQQMTLDKTMVFHYDPVRDHWLLFTFALASGKATCYEPLSQHGKALDIQDMSLLAKFFTPQRQTSPPERKPYYHYALRALNLQNDGASCGFWMATLVFLLACDVKINMDCISVLRGLGIDGIKHHWKCLLTSWRIEEKGLGAEPVNNFLEYWDIEFGLKSTSTTSTGCLAERPPWIPRFDPARIVRTLQEGHTLGHTTLDSDFCTTQPEQPLVESSPKSAPPQSTKTDVYALGPAYEATMVQIRACIKKLQTENTPLRFQRESINADDIERFLNFDKGKANDEVINIYVSIYNLPMGSENKPDDSPNHFGSLFRLPVPVCDFKVLTTFFYPKLTEYTKAFFAGKEDGDKSDKLRRRLLRWFKDDNSETLNRLLLPINDPPEVHWFLVYINFKNKQLHIYDSWPDNQQAWSAASWISETPYNEVLTRIRVLLHTLSSVWNRVLPEYDSSWVVDAIKIPGQTNTVDCGFFVLMVSLHLLYFNEVNYKDCPPALRLSGDTMKHTRVYLAASLVHWCSQPLTMTVTSTDNLSISPDRSSPELPLEVPSDDLLSTSETPSAARLEDMESESKVELDVVAETLHGEQANKPQEEELEHANSKVYISTSPVASSVDGEDELKEMDTYSLPSTLTTLPSSSRSSPEPLVQQQIPIVPAPLPLRRGPPRPGRQQ
ncbi:hypothetical protein B0H10DRAFT_2356313 [Mycena sp. CBHHK59/15]|nr:hypothetical protein B0H10DRAFT_2356313 [Mycena sp. CBHHK59/15]